MFSLQCVPAQGNRKKAEWEKKGERKRMMETLRQREGEHGVQHLFDCYLEAILSNYWLEPLKKLITGSHRLPSRQADLVPGTTQLSPGHLIPTPYTTAQLQVCPRLVRHFSPLVSVEQLSSQKWLKMSTSETGRAYRTPFTRRHIPNILFLCPWKLEETDSEVRCWRDRWWEKERVGEGADNLFPVFSQLQAWRSYFC